MRFKIALAALAATAAFASPAIAQTIDTEPAQARGIVLLPLTLTHDTNQPLDFGTVTASALAGTVSIDADNGARSVSGGVGAIALDLGGRAVFNGLGTEGQQVEITLNPVATLTGPGPDITVLSMDLDGCNCMSEIRTIATGSGGAFLVGVGGSFAIAANQANGVYTGTFSVTAEYN
jgi:hypothetical protein